ncbi:Pentatricopeptide repeat-containing protein At2g31400, partial [Durusdinium trenchii]
MLPRNTAADRRFHVYRDGSVKLSEAVGLLSDALENRCFTARLPTSVLTRLAKEKETQVALRVLHWMQKESLEVNSFHFSATLSACAASNDWQLALCMLDSAEINEVCFNAALDACLKAGQWKRSLELFREMPKRQLVADEVSCNVAIVSAALSSTWQLGLSFLNGVQADAISFSSCVSACERNGQWNLALTYLERLQQRNFEAYAICCNSAVSACAARWHLAFNLAGGMSDSSIQSDAFTYSSVLSALSADWEVAIHTMQLSQSKDEIVFNAAINTCVHGGWMTGLKLLDEMQTKGIRSKAHQHATAASEITYTAAALGCGAARWKLAELLFSKMKYVKVRPDVFAHNAALSFSEEVKRWQGALSCLLQMKSTEQVPDEISYTACLSASEKSSQWLWAVNILEAYEPTKVGAKQIALNAALSACEKSLQWSLAISIFSQLPQCRAIQDIISFGASISACEKASFWEITLILHSLSQESNAITYGAAISACAKGQQWKLALETLSYMLQSQVESDQINFNAAISASEKCQKWQVASLLLNTMTRSLIQPVDGSFNAAISACQKGQSALPAPPLPSTYSFGAAIAAWRSEWSLALDAWNRMQSIGLSTDDANCSALLSACVRGSCWRNAIGFLGETFLASEPSVQLVFASISACEVSEVPGRWPLKKDEK